MIVYPRILIQCTWPSLSFGVVISSLRGFWYFFHFHCSFHGNSYNVDPDQMQHSAATELGLHMSPDGIQVYKVLTL